MTPGEKRYARVAIVTLTIMGVVGIVLAFREMGREARRVTAARDLPVLNDLLDFSFTDQQGRRVSAADLKGHVWIADFIFTRCAGPCPLMTQQMLRLQETFDPNPNMSPRPAPPVASPSPVQEALDPYPYMRLVSFTVDPEFDTPAILKGYAERFKADHERWYFLTGPRKDIYDLCIKHFKLAVEDPEDPEFEHLIIHSTKFVLVDAQSRIRGYYDGTDAESVERLIADAARLHGDAGR